MTPWRLICSVLTGLALCVGLALSQGYLDAQAYSRETVTGTRAFADTLQAQLVQARATTAAQAGQLLVATAAATDAQRLTTELRQNLAQTQRELAACHTDLRVAGLAP